ncbi:hypothetical protein WMY93_005138 [Mugilogobius chulae]|uniref:Gypsy retrotransposon integrase-like protein 1 n=1 Tax=Mugilogobius chulae TaxID=88201 RepID=A0AAW0PRM4_9GOBI
MKRTARRPEEPDEGNAEPSASQGELSSSKAKDNVEELTALVKALIERQDDREKKHEKDKLLQEQRWEAMQRQFQQIQQQQKTSEPHELEVQGQNEPSCEYGESDSDDDGPDPGGYSYKPQREPKLPILTPEDDIEHFLITFERMAKVCRWPKEEWAVRLVPLLTGKARSAFVQMDIRHSNKYGRVKEAILSKYEITDETYRRRFRSLKLEPDETPRELYVRLKDLLNRWLQPEKSSQEDVWRSSSWSSFSVWSTQSSRSGSGSATLTVLKKQLVSPRPSCQRARDPEPATLDGSPVSPSQVSPMGVIKVVVLFLGFLKVSNPSPISLRQLKGHKQVAGSADWDQWLPYLLFAYREVPQASTGFSPFELLYGRQVRGPLDLLRDYWEQTETEGDNIIAYVQEDIKPLLDPSLFQETPGFTSLVQHKIRLKKDAPVRQRSYRIPERLVPVLQKEIMLMLELGIIEVSSSEWCSPIVLVPKKDGSLRFCIDFRYLNAISNFDPYPMPRIDDLLEKVGGAAFITTLDLSKGYWQLALAPEAKELTAFRTPFGMYQFKVMPFGLQGAPATFQRLMDHVLRDVSDFSAAYLDDVVVYSSSWEDHLCHLQEVLQRIRAAGLTINPRKCSLAHREVQYLGYTIGYGKIKPQVEKMEAIRSFPVPTTKRKVRGFIGLVGWYRKFVPHFSERSAVLTNLTKKNVPNKVRWTEECEQAFNDLKEAVCTEPVLASPDFSQPFILQTDASQTGLGAVLLQEREGERRPVVFLSRRLLDRETRELGGKRAIIKYEITMKLTWDDASGFKLEPDETPRELYVRLKDLLNRWLQPEKSSQEDVWEKLILEQFLRMVNPELEIWIRERDPDSAEEAARLAEAFLSARKGPRAGYFGREPRFTQPMPRPAAVPLMERRGRTTPVLVNGQKVEALLDSGCFQSVVLSSLVPEERRSRETTPLTCIHGDEHTYPTAEVYITVGGQTYLLNVALAENLPFDVILGNDIPTLLDLMSQSNVLEGEKVCNPVTEKPTVEPVNSVNVLTRAQKAKANFEELPFWEEEFEALPGKARKPKAQRRKEKFAGSPKEESQCSKPLSPVEFEIPTDIGALQKQDPSLKPWLEKASGQQGENKCLDETKYVIKNDILYQVNDKTEALALPHKFRQKVMELGHSIPWAGHMAFQKTLRRIGSRFAWPGMYTQISKFCKTCEKCQLTAGKGVGQAHLQPLPIIGTPFERIGMDIVGPLEKSSTGNRFILVLCDYATRYPEAFPLRSIKAKQIANCLLQLFSRVGVAKEILTDCGTNFMSKLLKQVYQLLGVKGIRTTPYHPQTDGLVERYNKTLKHMLRKFVCDTGADWDQWLPYLLFAYREVPQASTGFSPFELLYGRQVRGPLDLLRDYWEQTETEGDNIIAYVVKMRERLEAMAALAQEI